MQELKELFEKIHKEVERIQAKGGNVQYFEELEYIKNKCIEGMKA